MSKHANYRTFGLSESEGEFDYRVVCGISTFCGAQVIPPTTEKLRDAGVKAAVLGIPWEGGSMAGPGASYGPHFIRWASQWYQNGYHAEFDVNFSETLNLADCGDVAVNSDQVVTFQRAEWCVSEIYRAGAFPVVFGGDDAVTIPVARAIASQLGGNMGHIHIDAHSDTWNAEDPAKLTAANAVARIVELPNVDPRNIAIVGLNGPLSSPQGFREYITRQGIQVISIWDIDEMGVDKAIERVLETVWSGTDGVLLHTDIDSMDQGYLTSTAGPETAGLTPREVVKMVRAFVRQGVEAYVIPECTPVNDPANNAARVASRLALDALAIRANPGGSGRTGVA